MAETELHLVELGGNELVLAVRGGQGAVDTRRINVGVYEPGDKDGVGITLTMEQARHMRAFLNSVAP